MPKKLYFERDLVDVRITRKAHTLIVKRRRHREPIYRVIDRIVLSYLNNDASDWEAMYYDTMETLKDVRKNYNDLKALYDKAGFQTKLI